MADPAVSVIVPTWNRSGLLKLAIASVEAQTYTDWELIIADDGSTDDTAAVVRANVEPRLTLLSLQHAGNAARARNAALRVARGKYVAFLDSDDLWLPDKLATQVPALTRSGRRWGYTHTQLIDEAGRNLPPQSTPEQLQRARTMRRVLKVPSDIALPTVVAERSLLEEVGGFDETFLNCHDYELWTRLAERWPAHVTATPLSMVRIHAGRLESERIRAEESMARLYERRAKAAEDPAIAAECRVLRDEHRLRMAQAAIMKRDAGLAWRGIGSAASLWTQWTYWRTLASALLIPFPGIKRLLRQAIR